MGLATKYRGRAPALFALTIAIAATSCAANTMAARAEPAGRVLLTTTLADGTWAITTLDMATGTTQALPIKARQAWGGKWKPDGSSLLVEAITDESPGWFVADLDGSLTPLDMLDENAGRPDWGPDCDALVAGQRVATAVPIRSEIWVHSLDGTTSRQLTEIGAVAADPDWSADGEQITFEVRDSRLEQYELWTVRPDGSDLRRVVSAGDGHGSMPQLSPDTTELAFLRAVDRRAQVFVQELTTGDTRQVTDEADGAFDPVWSPDGAWLAFADDGGFVNAVRPDGTDQRRYDVRGVITDWGPVTGQCEIETST